jgi:hypothetical protein
LEYELLPKAQVLCRETMTTYLSEKNIKKR